jgi:Domain of unknown function (DUF4281)
MNTLPFSPAQLFQAANLLALTGWLVLVVNTFMRKDASLWPARIVPLVLAAGYLFTVAPLLPGSQVDFSSMAGVQALFANPWWVLAGWVHYLAFDLFIGSWQVNQARVLAMPRVVLLLCLGLTFMFGPVGLLLFFIAKQFLKKGAPHVA